MVALVAGVGDFHLLGCKMFRHGNGFNNRMGPGLDFGVVTAKAQGGDFGIFFHRQGADFFTVIDMIGIGAVAEFAGDGFVSPLEMNGRFIGVAFEAGGVGTMADGPQNLFIDGIGPIMAIFSKGIGDKLGFYHKGDTRCHNNGGHHHNQSEFIVGHLRFSLPGI